MTDRVTIPHDNRRVTLKHIDEVNRLMHGQVIDMPDTKRVLRIHHLVQLGHMDDAVHALRMLPPASRRYRMHPETLKAIRESARDQSGGDGEELVMITYTQLLELLDTYEGKNQ
ncbi:hypothetical protein OPIT5_03965 [Opitutaceae bacterium TAV5]|nr:hypothetical protein OPIT5_03965 [Opitutaceae bacterium TAV5]